MNLIKISLVLTLVAFVSACGGGGGGSSTTSSGGSSAGSSTSSTMDATGQEIVAAIMAGATSRAGGISSTVGGSISGSTARSSEVNVGNGIDITPVIEGGTPTGAIITYTDTRTSGTFSGYSSLNGRVVGSGDASGGDAQSEGLTREFVSFTNLPGRWTFDGVHNEDVNGDLSGGFLIGSIISTLGSDGFAAMDNDNGAEVYIFDDMRIAVTLTGDSGSQNVFCSDGGASFITLHKALGGPLMTCFLNSDCTSCIN